MIRSDLPDVLGIEAASATLNGITPWCEAGLVSHLKHRNCIAMAADLSDGRLAGFMLYEMNRCTLRLLRIGVASELRRHGVGMALLSKLKSKLSPTRRTKAVCIADERSSDLHYLLRAASFIAVDVVHDAFSIADDRYDGYRFEFSLDEPDLVMSSILCGCAKTVRSAAKSQNQICHQRQSRWQDSSC